LGKHYDHLTREELQNLLIKRDAERKLGLVWERNELEQDGSRKNEFVVADFQKELSIGEPSFENLIIEGDNLDALRFLSTAYRGKVQCIYIDPPYNRGNRDFIYNDRYLSDTDYFRHSKWLEYLYQRLVMSRDLLTPDGVILVSIDDNNRAKLELLLDQVFPGKRVGSLAWRKRRPSNAANIDYFFSSDHEHVLVYANKEFSFAGSEKRWSGYSNWDEKRQDSWASGDLTLGFTREQRPNLYYPIHNPDTAIWYPCDPNRVWTYASKERLHNREVRVAPMEDLISEGRVHFPTEEHAAFYDSLESLCLAIENGEAPPFMDQVMDVDFWVGKKIGFNKPRLKRYKKDLRRNTQPLSSWIAEWGKAENEQDDSYSYELESGMTQEGTKALRELNLEFPYPKPPSLIRNLIAQASTPDSIVLDFFAGSGTTAQAVMEVNEQDRGNRRFILVSSTEATSKNPERNICRDVTQRRVKAIIEKLQRESELEQGCAYLCIKPLPSEQIAYSLNDESVWIAVQLIHNGRIIPYHHEKQIQSISLANGMLVYLSRVNEEAIRELKDLIARQMGQIIIYSWQPGILSSRFENERITIEKIPDRLIVALGGKM